MTDFLKIAKSTVVHFAHICAYGVETVKLYYYLFPMWSRNIKSWGGGHNFHVLCVSELTSLSLPDSHSSFPSGPKGSYHLMIVLIER